MDADLETTPAPALENDDAGMEEDFDYNADDIGKEIKLTDDGGLIKKILVKGEGWETPEKGDEVQVHYVGTLNSDGSKFDSSRDRDEIFKFKLGLGQVVKGWDTGVASMKKGEKAILTCRADYAYGESGSPPKIPPNATLDFEVELLGWRSIKDISGDGGVIKTILEEGEGWDHPRGRDEVLVHYTAKLPGAEAPFAQSPDEGTSFTLEEGHLCPGLGTALESMKKGEKANLQLKPSYAFGESGNEALGVPADSNVEVSLRLVSWKKVEDVTDDGLVVKKALEVDPDEYKRPNEGATVTLRLTGRLPGGDVFEAYGEGNELVVKTCEEKMCEGLELAVMKMKRGEKALVTISDAKYGFGAAGRPAAGEGLAAVPANAAPLTYAVQLVAFENAKETWEMTEDEKVEAAKERKEKGNAYFKAANYKRAINFWDKAVNLVSYDKSMTPDQQAQVKDIKRSCWLNMAQVALKEQRWKDALTNCNKVLEADTTNVKALYRRAQAHKELQDYLEALLDVKKALELEPGNTDVKKLEQNIKVLQRQQNKKEAAMYSKMFSAKAAAAALDTAAAPDTGANTDAPATEQTATA